MDKESAAAQKGPHYEFRELLLYYFAYQAGVLTMRIFMIAGRPKPNRRLMGFLPPLAQAPTFQLYLPTQMSPNPVFATSRIHIYI